MALGDVSKISPSGVSGAVRFADLCTGTGCIGISLANEVIRHGRDISGVLTDISDTALKTAEENVTGCSVKQGILQVIRHDILSEDLTGGYDLIVSNPPYVTDAEMKQLDREVSGYEPHLALEAGEDGLRFYKTIFPRAYNALTDRGAVMVEHGCLQGEQVRSLCEEAGFKRIITLKDYGGNDRVTAGFKDAG